MQRGVIQTSTLVLLSFASAFFPRLFSSIGFPSAVNFLHFGLIPLTFGFALIKARKVNHQQMEVIQTLLAGLLLFLCVILASALWNDAGAINVFLQYILLAEPFLLLIAILCIPMTAKSCDRLRKWFIYFGIFHVILAYIQRYILRLHLTRALAGEDLIQGVFYFSGSGHVVGSSVALTFGLYYLFKAKLVPLWLRVVVFVATFWQMMMSDAKQVLLVLMVAWFLLLLGKFKNIAQFIQYTIAAIVVGYALLWCINNLEAFQAFKTWSDPELYGPNGDATLLKQASLRIIPTYFTSPVNWFLGLGPGHTVGRLGGWMIREYESLLKPLGVTSHPASKAVWTAVEASWLGNRSSMFSPLFGWAGIWGDLGLLGLATYLWLGWLVWQKLCLDDFSKFLLLTIVVNGLILSQMEEPGYMLYIAMIIGLQWQEQRISSLSNH